MKTQEVFFKDGCIFFSFDFKIPEIKEREKNLHNSTSLNSFNKELHIVFSEEGY